MAKKVAKCKNIFVVTDYLTYSYSVRNVQCSINLLNIFDVGSLPLVKLIVDQIIRMHKSYIKYLHIGGDEVGHRHFTKLSLTQFLIIFHENFKMPSTVMTPVCLFVCRKVLRNISIISFSLACI